MTPPRKKPLSALQKFLIITCVFGALGGAALFLTDVKGDTQIATTLAPSALSGPNSGLVGHWTFDGEGR
jgi:hypothetical protein